MDIIATNRQARFKYELMEKYEAGLVLTGSEVKSLRNKDASLSEAYAALRGSEIFLYNLHIAPYEQAGMFGHEPKRPRKLLLKRAEINKVIGKMNEKGYTLVPVKLYFTGRGIAKVQIALAKGKRLHDKRETIRKREVERDIQRALKG
ncbi:MAG: SsrA-binding protein SmpB [Planctomycetes bacterium]|nr:SsrA-binding protein SmpB [Planctomycetota bacterium]